MPESNDNQPASYATSPLMYPLALLLSLAVFAAGTILIARPEERGHLLGVALSTSGVLGIVITIAVWPLAVLMRNTHRLLQQQADRAAAQATSTAARLDQHLSVIREQQLISDRTKSVAFREKDREALRRAISEELGRQDWEAARILVDSMASEFGNQAEVERWRADIATKADAAISAHLTQVRTELARFIATENWPRAFELAQSTAAAHPGHSAAAALPRQVEQDRATIKRKLMDDWNTAVETHNVELGVTTLKRLDAYLTPAEALANQETARTFFRERLTQLSDLFKTAVKEHQWPTAISLGELLINDFPNTRISQEVLQVMDDLKKRASESTAPPAEATA